MIKAIINEYVPLSIASWPNEGPTTSDWIILAAAGSLPDFNALAKSCASSIVNDPEIEVLPVVIASLTLGAEYT